MAVARAEPEQRAQGPDARRHSATRMAAAPDGMAASKCPMQTNMAHRARGRPNMNFNEIKLKVLKQLNLIFI